MLTTNCQRTLLLHVYFTIEVPDSSSTNSESILGFNVQLNNIPPHKPTVVKQKKPYFAFRNFLYFNCVYLTRSYTYCYIIGHLLIYFV